jgi:glycosyltransferase involved in cell wall biosynthesis
MSEPRPLRVCFFGTYRANYVRNQVMIEGLRRQGVTVYECHAPLWRGVEDRVRQAGGGWLRPAFWRRAIAAYWRLWRAHWQTPDYDVMLVGYPGQFDVYLGRLLSLKRRQPMVLDILMSLHLIAEERGLTSQSPLTGRLIFHLEKWGLRLPDLLIADTADYQRYYCEKYSLRPEKFRRIPLGVDDRYFHPRPHIQPMTNCFRVLYYGTFIPLHGVETIIQAAMLLQHLSHIRFDFYGDGQERARSEELARDLNLDNVHFHGWLNTEHLPEKIAQAHVCLGVFGTTKQSQFTIQNKIWEGMMMQRPVITGDSDTVRAELVHKEHVYLVERANPQALAEAILELEANPELRQQMATAAYERAQNNNIWNTGRAMRRAIEPLATVSARCN